MGMIDRWFGGRERRAEPPQDVQAVFRKIRALLEDESAQNDLYLPEVSAAIRKGSSIDRIPGPRATSADFPATRYQSMAS
jgi:hypothetical protein